MRVPQTVAVHLVWQLRTLVSRRMRRYIPLLFGALRTSRMTRVVPGLTTGSRCLSLFPLPSMRAKHLFRNNWVLRSTFRCPMLVGASLVAGWSLRSETLVLTRVSAIRLPFCSLVSLSWCSFAFP